jgi:hypothetical protein
MRGNCPVCGAELAPYGGRGRPRRYCSTQHTDLATRRRRAEMARIGFAVTRAIADQADRKSA